MNNHKKNDIKICVVARDLENLRNQGEALLSRLENACGAVGAGIAMRVIENNGRAEVDLSALRMGLDVSYGVTEIFDNFELSVSKTGEPLVDFLAKFYLRSSTSKMNE